jgi:type III secretory pathway component EscR
MSNPQQHPDENTYTSLSLIALVTVIAGICFMVYSNTQLQDKPWTDVQAWFQVDDQVPSELRHHDF